MSDRSALILCTAVIFLALSGIIIPAANAKSNPASSPSLKGGQVAPENGVWDSSFTFKVTYASPENKPPSVGYPKLYINGSATAMEEKVPTDNNFVDGKAYSKEWVPGPENVGEHTFYFRVRDVSGESVRRPENENLVGPFVRKKPTELCLEASRENGEVIFSGSLKVSTENRGLNEENVAIYEELKENDQLIGNVQTDENGSYVLPLPIPGGKGIFRYRACFAGKEGYGRSESDPVYFHSLDGLFVAAVSSIFFLGLLGVIWYLLTRGMDRSSYLTPMVLGVFAGIFLISFLGIFGLFAGGLVIGYLLSRDIGGWANQARVGAVGGTMVSAVYGLLTLINLFIYPEMIKFPHSLSQGTFLKNYLLGSIPTLLIFALAMGMGAILGGVLRKLLK